MPNRNELASLVNLGNSFPALPTGHPFTRLDGGPQGDWVFWSSSTLLGGLIGEEVWVVNFGNGQVEVKDGLHWPLVIPVRDGP
jgi:hypothetical protein